MTNTNRIMLQIWENPLFILKLFKKTYTYSTWRNAEFRNVKVGGTGIYHYGLKGQNMTIFYVRHYIGELNIVFKCYQAT